MIKQAKADDRGSKSGKVRKVYVEYPQGWLYKLLETEGQQASTMGGLTLKEMD